MLAQLHAIQLRIARRRPEQLDAGLLRHVARENFQLLQPMLDALRAGDKKKIAAYDDLRPFDDHIQQIFSDAMMRLSPLPALPLPSHAVPEVEEDPHAKIIASLEGLGIPKDIAAPLLAQAMAENPGAAPFDLALAITDALKRRGPRSPAKPRKARAKPPAPSDPADLRVIVGQPREPGTSAYDALLAAGVIRPPAADFAA